jgi:bifunctional non-homologous end joining protein LigD
MPSARATRSHHPVRSTARPRARDAGALRLPADVNEVTVRVDGRDVHLTNLRKPFWDEPLITKGDLLQYYADVAALLLPHIRDRAMVMKRYPNGAAGDFFFMKRAPSPRPDWLALCAIEHASGNVIDFPVIQDLPSLLWVINLGCIDLNQWYAPCDDVDRPDALHFDLDPTPGATFAQVRDTALLVRQALEKLGMLAYAKTTGSRGIHVYVPIVRGPLQKQVWELAKGVSQALAAVAPKLVTTEYRVAKRPRERVLVDFNQNAWGRTLASVYSVRPRPRAPVSTPVTWKEIERGIEIEDFRLDNVRARLGKVGDLWAPLLADRDRFDLQALLGGPAPKKPAEKRRAEKKPAEKKSALPDAETRLKEYGRKRRFEVTAEPPPAVPATRGRALRFVVQKHRASRLHYDFRLEWDGALLSWAVPKGPSGDKKEKRLAMAVEDHPLDYADFEGVIPAGEYGGGTVMVWDRGTYEPREPDVGKSWREGRIVFTLAGTKLKGEWVLVRTRGRESNSWLLIKHGDDGATAADIVETAPRSVRSKRLMAEIAFDEGGDVQRAAGSDPPDAIRALMRDPDTRTRKPNARPAVWHSRPRHGS